jgi:hypothetical protein
MLLNHISSPADNLSRKHPSNSSMNQQVVKSAYSKISALDTLNASSLTVENVSHSLRQSKVSISAPAVIVTRLSNAAKSNRGADEQRSSVANKETAQKLEDIMGMLGEMISVGEVDEEEEEKRQVVKTTNRTTMETNSASVVSSSSNYPLHLKQSKHKLDDVMRLIGDVIQTNKRAPENTADFTNNAFLTSSLLHFLKNDENYEVPATSAQVVATTTTAATTKEPSETLSPASQIVAMSGQKEGERLRSATFSGTSSKASEPSPNMNEYYSEIEAFQNKNKGSSPVRQTIGEILSKKTFRRKH